VVDKSKQRVAIENAITKTQLVRFDKSELERCGVPYPEVLIQWQDCFAELAKAGMVAKSGRQLGKVPRSIVVRWLRVWFGPFKPIDYRQLQPYARPDSPEFIDGPAMLDMMKGAAWCHNQKWWKNAEFWLMRGRSGKWHLEKLIDGEYDGDGQQVNRYKPVDGEVVRGGRIEI
jgi:hypothetical protein